MAESKKYYWLKLQHDFFSSKRIKKLRRMENGDSCVIVYLKMQLKSIKNEGVLVFSGLEDSFEEELALDLDEDVAIVKDTVSFMLQFGLMEEIEEGAYALPYAKENTGSETQAAGRMRELRKRKAEHDDNKMEQGCNINEHGYGLHDEGVKNEPENQEKPKKENVFQMYERMNLEEFQFSPLIDKEMHNWLKYKVERRDSYKETGLLSLLRQVQKHVDKYGETEVAELIEKCMGSNWQGIIWERLEKGNYRSKSDRISTRVKEVDSW